MNVALFRIFDFVFAAAGLLVAWPILLILIILGLFDTGKPIFLQERVGRRGRPFTLIKLRTMKLDTASVGTHLVNASATTRLGRFLRRSKLDEVPQLVNVICGQMSLVGPRPCLPNQAELIASREALGVLEVLPGITGLAQVNGIDMSNPGLLADWDRKMIDEFSTMQYFRLLVATVLGAGGGDRIRES